MNILGGMRVLPTCVLLLSPSAYAVPSVPADHLVADCRSDWTFAGGAMEDADPLHSIRSGSPHQTSTATTLRPLLPGAVVRSLSFAYQYNTGYGPHGIGTNFTVRIAGTPVYTSPPLIDYRYSDNRSLYSPPVPVAVSGLSIAVPSNGSSSQLIDIIFHNNERNVQLLLPMAFDVGCDPGGPCLAPPLWEPRERVVVFAAGDKDESGTPCACYRVPALAVTSSRLVAFAEARFAGCRPDVSPHTAVAVRLSLDGLKGERWSEVRIVARTEGGGLNYPTPLYDAHTGVIHLFYADWGVGMYYMASHDDGETRTRIEPACTHACFCMRIHTRMRPWNHAYAGETWTRKERIVNASGSPKAVLAHGASLGGTQVRIRA